MSYMRGDVYIWAETEKLGIAVHSRTRDTPNVVMLPLDKADDLAVMLVAEMIAEGRLEAVMERVLREYDGNTGHTALAACMGAPDGFTDMLQGLKSKHAAALLAAPPEGR